MSKNRSIPMRSVGIFILLCLIAGMLTIPALAEPHDNNGGVCDSGLEKFDNNPRGSFTHGGVDFEITEHSVTVSGGDATICVKGGDTNSGTITLSDGETYDVDFTNNGGEIPGISHVVVYSVNVPEEECEPREDNCVDFTWETSCGVLTVSLTNDTQFFYEVRAKKGSEPQYAAGFPEGGEGSEADELIFTEDENSGEVTVWLWVEGAEADFVTGRDIPNFWEENAVEVSVDTDCEDEEPTCEDEGTCDDSCPQRDDCDEPTEDPTEDPSEDPTEDPTEESTEDPTEEPTEEVTEEETVEPVEQEEDENEPVLATLPHTGPGDWIPMLVAGLLSLLSGVLILRKTARITS